MNEVKIDSEKRLDVGTTESHWNAFYESYQ